VGVVVLDHDGSDLTRRCLLSLAATRWPSGSLSVVLVDNGSSAGLAARYGVEFPEVTVVDAGRNRGFAGGGNVGIEALGPTDYVALLNNDATVDPGWLVPLVAALEADPSVGAACPKIVFDGSFVELGLRSPTREGGGGDRRRLGVAVRGVRLDGHDAWRSAQLVEGFWGLQHDSRDGTPYQWTNGEALLRVPVRPDGSLPACQLLLSAAGATTVVATSGDGRTEHGVGPEPEWTEVAIGGTPFDVINNVGSVLLDRGYGADRGFLERDCGQYEEAEEVFAWCGAAVVLSRRYLDRTGVFDEGYFLYYEDFDLSWRGRAQGWRYLYVPGPPVRHLHSASAVEGSRLHHHYTERNRLLTLTRNAPAAMALRATAHHVLVTASYARRDVLRPVVRREDPSWEMVQRRAGAFVSYVGALPHALVERRRLRRARRVGDDELLGWMAGGKG